MEKYREDYHRKVQYISKMFLWCFHQGRLNSAGNYGNTSKMCEIFSKLTIKTPERR